MSDQSIICSRTSAIGLMKNFRRLLFFFRYRLVGGVTYNIDSLKKKNDTSCRDFGHQSYDDRVKWIPLSPITFYLFMKLKALFSNKNNFKN